MRYFLLSLTFLAITSFGQDTLRLYFPVDQFSLNSQQQQQIQQLKDAQILQVRAHTDADATNNYNQILSERRLESVTAALNTSQSNMTSARLIALGEYEQAYSSKAQNRRVDVIYLKTKPVETNTVNPGQIKHNLIRQLKTIHNCVSSFCINPNKDTLLIGDRGTVVKITAGTFKNVNGCVEIVITEPSNVSDMVLYNLTTQTADGQLLETDGMIQIEAFYQKKPIEPNKPLLVMKPTKKTDPEMKLFKGQPNSADDVVWSTSADLEMLGTINPDDDLHNLFGSSGGFNPGDCESDVLPPKCRFFFCKIRRVFEGKKKRLNRIAADSLRANLANWCISREEKLAEIEEQFSPLDEADLSKIPLESVSYYVFNANSLGWINIDKFSDYNGPRVDFAVNVAGNEDVELKLAFSKIRSILPGFRQGKSYIFKNVPLGMDVSIIGFEYSNPPKMAIVKTKTSKKYSDPFPFTEMTVKEMKQLLEKLD